MNKFKLIFLVTITCFCLKTGAQSENLLIEIATRGTAMVFSTGENNKLRLLHYGARLEKLSELHENQSQAPEAYPSFGLGTFHQQAFSMTQADGDMSASLVYKGYEQSQLENGVQRTTIFLADEYYPIEVQLHFEAYPDEDIIEQWVTIGNQGTKPVQLHEFASSYLHFKRDKYYLTHFYGSWGNEMNLREEELSYGMKVIDTKLGLETGDRHTAAYLLSLDKPAGENEGEVIMGALAWSGNYRLAFDVDDREHLHLICGINPYLSDYLLEAGKKLNTPRMIQTYTREGKGQASRNFHRWARKYVVPLANQERKTLINSWEAVYFKPDEQKVKAIIDGASQLGIEMFVLDDGWFGNEYPRNDSKAGLGDWQVTQANFPNGLEEVIDYAGQKNMLFGIWVEPEGVNPNSNLYHKHPDWVIQQKNRQPVYVRNQLTLDLSNPEVQDFMVETVSGLLYRYPQIAYVKWDANGVITNFGSVYLPENKQSQLWIDYVNGLYSVLARVREKHPSVIFQACGGGGSRADYGMLRYMNEFWTSDNTDASQRLFIQWGSSYIMPALCMASHVSASPNHQTGREIPLKFRCDVAMSGRMGMEMQPEWMTSEEKDFAKAAIAEYKRIRSLVQFGDLYRLRSPYESELSSLMYTSEDKQGAVLFAWSRHRKIGTQYANIRLNGLDRKKYYIIKEINPAPNEKENSPPRYNFMQKAFSGEYLMEVGLNLLNNEGKNKDYQSVVLELKSTENPQ